jgi:hypothetical protein
MGVELLGEVLDRQSDRSAEEFRSDAEGKYTTIIEI